MRAENEAQAKLVTAVVPLLALDSDRWQAQLEAGLELMALQGRVPAEARLVFLSGLLLKVAEHNRLKSEGKITQAQQRYLETQYRDLQEAC